MSNNSNKSIMKSGAFKKTNVFYDPVSPTLNHNLTAGQKVSAMNVPLVSFDNPVLDDMQSDVFFSMYLAESQLRKTPPVGREEVRRVLDWLLSDPTFKMNTLQFVNHKVSAAASAYQMVQELMNMPNMSNAMNNLGDAENMENQADDLENQADGMENPNGNGQDQRNGNNPQQDSSYDENEADNQDGSDSTEEEEEPRQQNQPKGQKPRQQPKNQPTPEQMRQRADQLRQQAQKKRQAGQSDIDKVLNNQMSKFGRAGSISAGSDFGNDVMGFLSTWGIEEGQGMMMSPEQISAIMSTLTSTSIAQLTSYIGRVHGIATATLRGRFQAQVMIDTAGMTKDVRSLHPTELAKLTTKNPARNHAIHEFLTKGAGGITKSMQAVQEGAFIVFVDESGSMDERLEGNSTREEVAKALALGLCLAAKDNGQEFFAAGFGTSNEITDLVNNNSSFEDMLNWATHAFDGGTDFCFALNTMMDVFEGYEEEDRFKADLLMVTDGQAYVDEQTIERLNQLRDRYGMRLMVLLIGNDRAYNLLEICDRVLKFTGLDNVAQTLSQFMWEEISRV